MYFLVCGSIGCGRGRQYTGDRKMKTPQAQGINPSIEQLPLMDRFEETCDRCIFAKTVSGVIRFYQLDASGGEASFSEAEGERCKIRHKDPDSQAPGTICGCPLLQRRVEREGRPDKMVQICPCHDIRDRKRPQEKVAVGNSNVNNARAGYAHASSANPTNNVNVVRACGYDRDSICAVQ